jgi:hypothetical protein
MDKREATLKVFGRAFSFESGLASPEEQEAYWTERYEAVAACNGLVWMARNLDSDRGLAADLYLRGFGTLLLDYDFETDRTDVYENPVKGIHDGSIIVEQASFEEAVEGAEAYLAPRIEVLKRNGQL